MPNTLRKKYPRISGFLKTATQHNNLIETWFPNGTGANNTPKRAVRFALRASTTISQFATLYELYCESVFMEMVKTWDDQGYVPLNIYEEGRIFVCYLNTKRLLVEVSHNTYEFDSDGISVKGYDTQGFTYFTEKKQANMPRAYASRFSGMVVRGDWRTWLARRVWDQSSSGLIVDSAPWFLCAKPHPGFGDAIVLDPEPDGEAYMAAARAAAALTHNRSRRLLLLGPPGTGKSRYAYDLCRRLCGPRVLVVSASAGFDSPGIDALAPDAVILEDVDRNVDQTAMLSYLENLRGRVLVVLTANVTSQIDPALVRSGRVDDIVETKVPSGDWLRDIIRHYEEVEGFALPPGVAESLDGLTPAAIREVVQSIRDVGAEYAEHEVARVRRHAEYYTENRTVEFLKKR